MIIATDRGPRRDEIAEITDGLGAPFLVFRVSPLDAECIRAGRTWAARSTAAAGTIPARSAPYRS